MYNFVFPQQSLQPKLSDEPWKIHVRCFMAAREARLHARHDVSHVPVRRHGAQWSLEPTGIHATCQQWSEAQTLSRN